MPLSSRSAPETYTDIADELHALEQHAREIEAIHAEDNSLGFPVADLHCHYGTSVSPEQLWRQLRRGGTKILIRGQRIIDSRNLPGLIQISPDDPREMTPYFEEIYHPVLDKLTTGVEPARASFEAIFSGAYSIGIDKLEVRTNPMKHNAGDEYDLDELIEGMSDGMRQAFKLHPQLYGGVILCIAREWENTGDAKANQRGFVKNSKIIEKAIKHADSGIVGIDIAGPDHRDGLPFPVDKYVELFQDAKAAGLGVTVHSGETPKANDIAAMLRLNPDRIGHGTLAALNPRLMVELRERGIVLEVCPLSNLALSNVKDWDEMGRRIRTLFDNEVKFTFATDWPEIIKGGRLLNVYREIARRRILTVDELRHVAATGMEASFVKQPGRYPHMSR